MGPVKPAAQTNAPAFEQELLAALAAVHRFAVQLARDRSAAEDLVQETYLRALAHRDQYASGTNCRAWLFTICRNVFLKGAMRDAREVAMDAKAKGCPMIDEPVSGGVAGAEARALTFMVAGA